MALCSHQHKVDRPDSLIGSQPQTASFSLDYSLLHMLYLTSTHGMCSTSQLSEALILAQSTPLNDRVLFHYTHSIHWNDVCCPRLLMASAPIT